jgi:hypothetical protein
MLFYSEKHIVCGEYIFEDWDSELVKHALSFFNPDNMRVDVLSKSFDKQSQGNQSMMPFTTLLTSLNLKTLHWHKLMDICLCNRQIGSSWV